MNLDLKRILVVDDEPRNQRLLQVFLEPEGLLVQVAASGEEALAMVNESPPDLILLDVMMPGMDGYEVVRRLKEGEHSKNIPVIMVTALDDRAAKMRGLTAGAEDFLSKPVDRAELCVRVRNLLRLKAYGEYYDKYSRVLEGEVESRSADLVESELLYGSTFDELPVGIAHVSRQGSWLRVNKRLCDLLGYRRDQLQGDSVLELLRSNLMTGEVAALESLANGTSDRHVWEEKSFQKSDGSLIWARVKMSFYRDAANQSSHFLVVIEDMTERRTLELELRQANKMNAIGRLASGVAHDFNNFLTVILGYTEILKTDAIGMAQIDLDEIIKAAESAAGLTAQLLAFSRQQVLHPRAVDINTLVQSTTGMLARLIGENIKVEVVLTPGLSLVLADRGQLEQVLMNLMVNAKDAMPDGGTLTVETGQVQLENNDVAEGVPHTEKYVTIAVSDTGAGMSEQTRSRIFEPFFTTKELGMGTGLGLSTTYGIVRQSKGYLSVQSELGRGSTFKVHLPLAPEVPLAEASPVLLAAADKRPSETLLLVEDEPSVRRLSSRILSRAGYRVLEAADGEDAERQFLLHASSIDLIVTDVVMPNRGGPELIERLRVHEPTLRVVYMSGYTDRSLALDDNDEDVRFIQKPFLGPDLLRQVRELLDR